MANVKNAIILHFIVTMLIALPLLPLAVSGIYRLDSDYDMLYPMAEIVQKTYTTDIVTIFRNPLFGTGISNIGDLGSLIFHPVFVPVILVFGAVNGIYVMELLSVFASGITMWYVLRKVGVDGFALFWGSVAYQLSGALFASFAAGHVIKFLSYPLIPLCAYIVLLKKSSVRQIVMLGSMVALMIYAADFYTPWFLLIFFVSVRLFMMSRGEISAQSAIKEGLLSIFIMLLITSPRVIAYLTWTYPHMERFYRIDPYAGSIHPVLSWIPYMFPLKVEFWDRPFFQRLFGFHFNWYEYYAFLTPIPFVLALFTKEAKNRYVPYLWVMIITGILYVALAYPFSPFYYLFGLIPHLQGIFRVPHLMFFVLVSVIIMILSIRFFTFFTVQKDITKMFIAAGLLVLSLVWLYADDLQMLQGIMGRKYPEEEYIALELKRRDTGNFRVASFVCCIQTFLIENDIPIVNMYYAWRPDNVPSFINEREDGHDMSPLTHFRPKYVILPRDEDVSRYGYVLDFESETIRVWKTEAVTVPY